MRWFSGRERPGRHHRYTRPVGSTISEAAPPPNITAHISTPLLSRPVRIDLEPEHGAPAVASVAAVVPCHGRRDDLGLLLRDLAGLDLAPCRIELRVLVVDNASEEPLATIAIPAGLLVEHVRLERNTGGSGGFNAGLRRVLGLDDAPAAPGSPAGRPEFLWLIDSDVRVHPETLGALVRALRQNAGLCAAGSALADPLTGRVFEVGGMVDRRTGRLRPAARGLAGLEGGGPLVVDYVASCSALVRREAIDAAGLLPDVFLSCDDVEWCIRLALATGKKIGAVPGSIAVHPRFDRFATTARYYVARNALGPARALGLPLAVRLRRAMHEVLRAVGQQMMGRADLARLHLRGLADCAAGRLTGPARGGPLRFEGFHPFGELAECLRDARGPVRRGRALIEHPRDLGLSQEQLEDLTRRLAGAGLRVIGAPSGGPGSVIVGLLLGPGADVAVVAAKGRPRSWLLGRLQVEIAAGVCAGEGGWRAPGFVVRPANHLRTLARAAATGMRGTWLAARAALRDVPPAAADEPPVPTGTDSAAVRTAAAARPAPGSPTLTHRAAPAPPVPPAPDARARVVESKASAKAVSLPTLSVVVLSYNRWGMLSGTLARLARLPALAGAQVVVVDNASADGSAERTARQFPRVHVERLKRNIGVAAFNRGVELATGEVVLVLDDDAWPDERAVEGGLELLGRRPDIGAVALHPRHPETGRSEWSFADRVLGGAATDRWPVMGCGNLIRRDVWRAVGGYEPAFFLYRNDVDMALKILGRARAAAPGEAGETWGLHFDPSWTVWHQSPVARRKSGRWHRLATRNWIWLARRHGRGPGLGGVCGALLGWAWAHRLAMLSPVAHIQTLRGAAEGWLRRPPALAQRAPEAARSFRRLIWIRLGRDRR